MFFARTARAMRAYLGASGAAVTIGGFDGIHIGHQALIARVREAADQLGVPAVVMSFEPLPKEYFARDVAPARLTRFRERFVVLDELGIDAFFCPRFDAKLAAIPVQRFIDDLLIDALGLRHLVIGDDFRFGHRAAGGVDDLRRAGPEHGFELEQVGSVFLGDVRVSSTRVREALARGDMNWVRRALDRPYCLTGKVIEGEQLGRTLGYPTANLRLHRRTSPVSGIFAVRVAGVGEGWRDGVASIGTRPTVDGVGVLLEVHVFDFAGDLYGRRLKVELVEKLRDEERFDNLDALVEQMNADAAAARVALAANMAP
ncbi:MAG: bifunctional riboflavin kinase/FAD synthetase [Pseudomonadota bacterium]